MMKRSLAIITGTSGFGRHICLQLAKSQRFSIENTHYVLISKSQESLQGAQQNLISLLASPAAATIETIQIDFTQPDLLHSQVDSLFNGLAQQNMQFDNTILVHNAGTIGNLKYLDEISSRIHSDPNCEEEGFVEHIHANITSSFILFSRYISFLKQCVPSVTDRSYLVNISSLMSTLSYESWSMYCSSKAARRMLCQVIAKENREVLANLKVLNYQPGPLENTGMTQIISKGMSHKANEEYFNNLTRKSEWVKCEESASSLVDILEKNTFESGQDLDYYDII